jgi:hypothetical protein
MKLCFLNFTLSHEKKNILFFINRFLEHVQPSVGSSGVVETPQSLGMGCHITARIFFTYVD